VELSGRKSEPLRELTRGGIVNAKDACDKARVTSLTVTLTFQLRIAPGASPSQAWRRRRSRLLKLAISHRRRRR
jgi:hypothetical protein